MTCGTNLQTRSTLYCNFLEPIDSLGTFSLLLVNTPIRSHLWGKLRKVCGWDVDAG